MGRPPCPQAPPLTLPPPVRPSLKWACVPPRAEVHSSCCNLWELRALSNPEVNYEARGDQEGPWIPQSSPTPATA